VTLKSAHWAGASFHLWMEAMTVKSLLSFFDNILAVFRSATFLLIHYEDCPDKVKIIENNSASC